MPHVELKECPIPHGTHLEPCPVCGSDAELWQWSESLDSTTKKFVRCANYEAFGPQEREVNEGCLLFMPPHEFYRATVHEATRYWNEYALALPSLRQRNSK